MMRILMVITEGDLGGAQRHVLDLSRELVRRGHKVTVAIGGVFTELEHAAQSGTPAIPVVRLHNTIREIRPLTDVRGLFELYKLVRRIRPDIVHCHSSKAGILASIAGRLAGAAVVYTAHGFVFREELAMHTKVFYVVAEKIATLFRHKVIAVSQSDADAARNHRIVRTKKITVIPNGIDTTLEEQLLQPDVARRAMGEWCGTKFTDEKIILSIANFYPAKNIPLLIHAFEFVVPRISNARLVLVGDGLQFDACQRLVRENPRLSGVVFFAGKQTDAFRILRGADVLCLASTKEGMPYVVLEARLAGTPVVATRVGGVPEMGEGPDLRLVVPHSAELLSDAIVETVRGGGISRVGLQPLFTVRGMVDAVEEIYRQVLASRARARSSRNG